MRMFNLLADVLIAWDEFMASDLDTHLTNPSWEKLSWAMHRIRVYFGEQRHLSVAGGKRKDNEAHT